MRILACLSLLLLVSVLAFSADAPAPLDDPEAAGANAGRLLDAFRAATLATLDHVYGEVVTADAFLDGR